MGHMTLENTQPYEPRFWKENNLDLKKAYVEKLAPETNELVFSDGQKMKYDALVLAVGSKSNKFGWPGQDLPGVQGLYSYQDLELLEENSKGAKRAVIIGGGLIGIELAEMLLSRGIKVTFLIREKRFWNGVLPDGESDLVTRHVFEHGVDLRVQTELDEIIAGEDGRVSKVRTKSGEEIPCQLVGLTAGVSPNIDFLKGGQLEINRGILVDEYLETNIPHVYAIGDCAEFRNPVEGRRPFEQIWYTGKIMGEAVAKSICGVKTKYLPGQWFNSAKFFDIEYQTYGRVFPKLKDEEANFYWEHENGKMCIHMVFHKTTRKFIGINAFGIRLRHHAFDRWLNDEKTVEYVVEHLKDANFDPEFYKQHEGAIVAKFNKEQNTDIQVAKKSWARILNFIN